MTEVAPGVPVPGVPFPRTDPDDEPTGVAVTRRVPAVDEELTGDALSTVEPASSLGDRTASSLGDGADRFRAAASGAAERVTTFAGGAADRAGDAVDRASAASGRIAAQVVDRLRNNAELSADRGSTTIADEVVEKIAGFATREVPGVFDLGGDVSRVFAAVKERIGLGEADNQNDRGVTVRLDGRTAGVKVVIVIEYGFVVYSVTEQVRAKVIDAVENMLGLEVTAVDIVVDDVHIDEARLASAGVIGAGSGGASAPPAG